MHKSDWLVYLLVTPIIVTETTISTFSFIISRLKSLAVSVSSAVSVALSTTLRGFGTKVVNGSAINSKTLG